MMQGDFSGAERLESAVFERRLQRVAAVRRKAAKPKRPSFFKEVVSGLGAIAMGQVDFPVPGIGGMVPKGQVPAIFRQQLARVPLPVKVGGIAAAGIGAGQAIELVTGRSPARIVHDAARGRLVPGFPQQQPQRSAPMAARKNGLAVGQELPPSHVVVRTWQTFPGGPIFARLADGHIAVQKKDGTIKHFRPYRPVVIPRKWNARSMSRVATALKRQRKTATKILKITGGLPTRTVRVGGKAHRSVDV